MKLRVICLFSAGMALLFSSCVVRETVTENGELLKEDYKIIHPVKDLIKNSENSEN